jgi:hypothetical protein
MKYSTSLAVIAALFASTQARSLNQLRPLVLAQATQDVAAPEATPEATTEEAKTETTIPDAYEGILEASENNR